MKYYRITTKHDQLTDVETPHVAADIFTTFERVSETTVAGAAVQQVDITGLDLDTDKYYLIVVKIDNTTVAERSYTLYANADTTAGNYYDQYLNAIAGAVTAARANDGLMGACDANTCGFFIIHMLRDQDNYPRAFIFSNSFAAASVRFQNSAWIHNDTTNVTQINLKGSAADSIGIGSRITIFKMSA